MYFIKCAWRLTDFNILLQVYTEHLQRTGRPDDAMAAAVAAAAAAAGAAAEVEKRFVSQVGFTGFKNAT